MPDKRMQILVIGSGLCGLVIAATAARRGFQVRCIGDGRPGSSLANFGQLHSYPIDRDLSLHWGTVCEPANAHADPTSLVVDLRDPPTGWSRAANLVLALPGKWTTAWHCAERVVDTLG